MARTPLLPPTRRIRPSHPRRLARSIGLLAFALPCFALAAQIKGKVVGFEKLLNPVWNEAKDVSAHRFTWREPSPTVRADLRNLSAFPPKEICIAAIATSAQQAPPLPLLITVGGGRTTPVTVVVTPGTRLHFENRDPFPHKLYGVGQSTFPAGETAPLAARDWTAPGPGRYEIRDELSPSVRAWVVVDPNVAAVAYPARDGSFLIPQLSPGEYTVHAYFGGSPVGAPKSFVLGYVNVDIALSVAEGGDAKGGKGAAVEKPEKEKE
jgi:hypothetical protein